MKLTILHLISYKRLSQTSQPIADNTIYFETMLLEPLYTLDIISYNLMLDYINRMYIRFSTLLTCGLVVFFVGAGGVSFVLFTLPPPLRSSP